jgi:hypothetical protein
MSADGYHIFSCLFEEKIKNKVSIKSFNNSENPSITLCRKLVPAFR